MLTSRTIAGSWKLSIALLAAGCASQINDPFRDEGAAARVEMTTPAADAYLAMDEPIEQARRDLPEGVVYYHRTGVTHWPVWFENPVIEKGNDPLDPSHRDAADQTFAVNCNDFCAAPYNYLRFAANFALWPISAIVTPPGTVMISDGRLSPDLFGNYNHDAARSSAGVEPPFWVGYERGEKAQAAPAAEVESPSATPATAPQESQPAGKTEESPPEDTGCLVP